MPAALARKGITVLKDQRTRVMIRGDALELAGIRFWTRRPADIARVLKGADDPVLLLAHDPRRLTKRLRSNVPAVLSGHTHGGQVVAARAWRHRARAVSHRRRDLAGARTRRSSSVAESERFTCRCGSTARRKSRSSHCSGSRRPDHATAVDPPSAIEHERNRLRDRRDAPRRGSAPPASPRCRRQDRHSALNDDRTCVEVRRDEVHGHAARLDAVIERLLLRVKTGKRRQQRRVDVENRVRERVDATARRRFRMNPARHTSRDVARASSLHQRAIVVVARGPAAMTQCQRLDTGAPRALEPAGVCLIGDDDGDGGVEPAARRSRR